MTSQQDDLARQQARRVLLRNVLGGLHAILHRDDRTLVIRASGKETTVHLDTLIVELTAASQPTIVRVSLNDLMSEEGEVKGS